MSLNPLVSIAVPTCNRAAVLRESLENICGQDYPRLEILISDNCSTDGTEQVCRAAAAADSRIRYIRQAQNIGIHENHDFCMDEARGEFLCFFHDHDRRDSRFVSKQVEFMRQHPRVGAVGSDWELIDDAGTRLGVRSFRGPSVSAGVTYTTRTIRSGRSSIGIPGGMIRMEALGAARFGPDVPIGFGDFPIWFRVAENWDIGHIHEPLSSWRQNVVSFSARPIIEIAHDYEKNIGNYCDNHLRRRPANADLVETWRAGLHRFLFWALAYEVALHFRRRGMSGTSHRVRTVFEMMDYELTPEQLEHALAQMKRHRSGAVEYAALATVQALIRLRVTSPLGWIVRHHEAFRALLGLR